jgi:hypothetical protein
MPIHNHNEIDSKMLGRKIFYVGFHNLLKSDKVFPIWTAPVPQSGSGALGPMEW